MKNFFKLFSILLVVGLALSTTAWGQLFEENFVYSLGQLDAVNGGANVSGGNWVNYSGTTLPLTVTSGSLSYTGYISSGIGNKVDVTYGSAEDAARLFTSQGVGTKTYASFLMNVTSTTGLVANTSTTGDYTVSFMPTSGTSVLVGRVSLRIGSVASTFNVGMRISSSNAAAVWKATDYPINTPVLVVISYEVISGNANDIANLWVNPDISGAEPTPDATQTSALAADPTEIARITIRQGTNSFPGQLDGIRVSTTWVDAPLPIQLASFVGNYFENGAKLEWSTISEKNNYGFNVQRLNETSKNYETVGFVEGKGTTLQSQSYSYTDAVAGTAYRLEQLDNDGLKNYFGPIYLNPNGVGDNSVPAVFGLNQNYPNPFNPSTVINYQLATDNYTTLKVYNLIGKEVATLVNGFVTAGSHDVTFNASQLTSGIYFYKLQSGNSVEVKKLTLVK